MNTQPAPVIKHTINNDEIDLLELAKTLWDGRIKILKYIVTAGVIGIFIAILTPKEYVASISMIPESSQSGSNLGGLSSLASFAGLNLDIGNSGETMTPQVYPQIVTSVPFQLELMNIPFKFSDVDHPVSLMEYYSKIAKPGVLKLIREYTIGLPGLIVSIISSTNEDQVLSSNKATSKATSINEGNLIYISDEQAGVCGIIGQKVTLTIDAKQGLFILKSAFHQPLLSAQVAEKARELLQKYITRYKIEKAKDQLTFIEERYLEKKKEYIKIQEQLARFRDQNKNVISALVKTDEERLQSEFNIAMNVFNELAKQLEQAKIKVKEVTPVFLILEPVIIPREKSKPNKVKIVFIWLFLGGILGIGSIFAKVFLNYFRILWNEPKTRVN